MTANQMAGKPTAGQQFVKDTLKHLGAKKATGREFEHVAQRAIYRVTLGYALDSAANYIRATFDSLGFETREQTYTAGKATFRNIVLSLLTASGVALLASSLPTIVGRM